MKEKIINWLQEHYGDASSVGDPSWSDCAEGIMEWKIEERSFENAFDLLWALYGYDVEEAKSLIRVIQS